MKNKILNMTGAESQSTRLMFYVTSNLTKVTKKVVQPNPETLKRVQSLLRFDMSPGLLLLMSRSRALINIVTDSGYSACLLEAPPFLSSFIETESQKRGVTVFYIFSKTQTHCELIESIAHSERYYVG